MDQSRLTLDNYTAEECIVITKMLIERFEQAKMNGPVSAKLLMTLGVLYFISRDYKTAVENFQKSLHMDPTNYSGWNKFGAALAHLGQRKLSRDAYHKALDLKPNYMRAWINLAFSYGNEVSYNALVFLERPRIRFELLPEWTFPQPKCSACVGLRRIGLGNPPGIRLYPYDQGQRPEGLRQQIQHR